MGTALRSRMMWFSIVAVCLVGAAALTVYLAPWRRPGAPTRSGEVSNGAARPVFTELTPDVIRTARFIDMDPSIRNRATRAQEIEEEESAWASSAFLPATYPAAALVEAWQDSVHDPDQILTSSQRHALLTKLAEYARVRALPTPDAYFILADREPNLIWHDPETPYKAGDTTPFRKKLEWLYENYGDGPVDSAADTPQLLRDLWPSMMGKYGQRIAEIGVGPRGAAIIIMRSRLPQRSTNGGFAEPYASLHGLTVDRWVGYGVSWARPFRIPVRTSDDVLEERGIVTLVAAHIIVRLASAPDHLFVWGVYGFLDPETNEWQVELMDKSGSRNWQVVF